MELILIGIARLTTGFVIQRHFNKIASSPLKISQRFLGTRLYEGPGIAHLTDSRMDLLKDHKDLLDDYNNIVIGNEHFKGTEIIDKVYVTDLPIAFRVVYPGNIDPKDIPDRLIDFYRTISFIFLGIAIYSFLVRKKCNGFLLANLIK